jgi:AcrR family transcriptional regulator
MPPTERREQLLDAAQRVIATEGYRGVTIESIARTAGVTRPVVYSVFENLGDLLHALLDRQEARALSQLSRVLPADPGDRDPDQVVIAGVEAFLGAVAEDPDTWRPILLPPDGTPPLARKRVEQGREAALRQLESLAAWGLERWGGPEALDAELAARAIQVLGEEAGRLVLSDPEQYPPERLAGFVKGALAAISV